MSGNPEAFDHLSFQNDAFQTGGITPPVNTTGGGGGSYRQEYRPGERRHRGLEWDKLNEPAIVAEWLEEAYAAAYAVDARPEFKALVDEAVSEAPTDPTDWLALAADAAMVRKLLEAYQRELDFFDRLRREDEEIVLILSHAVMQ